MINLRQYQTDAIDAIRDTFSQEDRQYVEMPTGAGKTITFLSYASEYHKRILVIVPSKQLLNQVKETATLFYHSSEISQKGDGKDQEPLKLHICIINSIRGDYIDYLAEIDFDLIIIDEAHHTQATSYKRFIKSREFFYENSKILGVTATPDRIDGQLLKNILYTNSYKITIRDLIHQKYLSDIEGYRLKTNIDISQIDDHNGDFNINQLYKKLCIESRNDMIVDVCKREMKERKLLIFCINIEHSKQISQLLEKNKISSCHIDGSMGNIQRNSILNSFKNGEISVLCNCQLLTEGFDEPSINGIILARPTRSKSLFLQMIGRGLRIFPGKKNCKIIDIVDNHRCLAGFNSIVEDQQYPEMDEFKNLKELEKHLGDERLKVTEFIIERADLLESRRIDDENATPSMEEYLHKNEIKYMHPLSFGEGSFLIWYNELKKEFYGINRKKKK